MLKNIPKEYKWLTAILFAALVVRVVYFIYDKPWERDYFAGIEASADAIEYQLLSNKIIETGSYPENFFLDTYRTPGFPLFVVLIYSVFGAKVHYVLFSHIFLNLIIILFVFLLCRKLFENKTAALLAAALYALEPNIIKLVTEFGTETLHATFLIISVYFFLSGLKDNKIFPLALSAVFFALTALIRPINLYFYLLCLLFIFFYPKQKILYKFKLALLFVAVYFVSISPWMYRNYKAYGHFSTNAFQGTAVIFNAIITKSTIAGVEPNNMIVETITNVDKICKEKNITNPFDVDKEKEIYGLNYIKYNMGAFIKLHLKGMINFFAAPVNNAKYSFKNKMIIGSYLLSIYLTSVLGLIILIRKKYYYFVFIFLTSIFYYWFVTGMVGLSRYRIPTTAFYIVFSAIGIYFIYEKIKSKLSAKKL